MAVVGRIFEWFQHFLGTPGAEGTGPREYLDTVVPVVDSFGTGRLTRKEIRFEGLAANTNELIGTSPAGDKVRLLLATQFFHDEAAASVSMSLFLRCQLGGTDRDLMLTRGPNLSTNELRTLNGSFLIPGDCRLVLRTDGGGGVDRLRLEYLFLEMELGETAWFPGGPRALGGGF